MYSSTDFAALQQNADFVVALFLFWRGAVAGGEFCAGEWSDGAGVLRADASIPPYNFGIGRGRTLKLPACQGCGGMRTSHPTDVDNSRGQIISGALVVTDTTDSL